MHTYIHTHTHTHTQAPYTYTRATSWNYGPHQYLCGETIDSNVYETTETNKHSNRNTMKLLTTNNVPLVSAHADSPNGDLDDGDAR